MTDAMNVEMMESEMAEIVDMGYEDAAPMKRRGSMTHQQEKERRASIKAIMSDTTITPMAKRLSIQHIMDGRRNSINASAHSGRNSVCGSAASSTCEETPECLDADNTPYGYGDEEPMIQSGRVGQAGDPYAFSNEQTRRTEQGRPPCSHYERNCTIIAPCCGAAFGCRICHDDCPALPPKIIRKYHRSASLPSSFTSMGTPQPEDNHHEIDRFAITEVICRECFTRQSSKTYVKGGSRSHMRQVHLD
jgi:hypothetical protein